MSRAPDDAPRVEGTPSRPDVRSGLGRWLRRVGCEPLFHFLLLGALIFAGIEAARAMQRPTVRITAQDVEQLVQYWQLQTQRAPTRDELAAIIQGRIDEELLAREAMRLGMDKDDMIIRRRLAQKMSFASEDLGDIQPSDAALQEAFRRNPARYAIPGQVALRHVLFSADRGIGAARAAAEAALARANAGVDPAGDPSLLPLTYADADPEALRRDYGPDFVKAVASAPLVRWVGPVQSPFGFHLLKVARRARRTVPSFETVRDRVRDDVVAEQRQAKNEAFLRQLRGRYRVQVEDIPS